MQRIAGTEGGAEILRHQLTTAWEICLLDEGDDLDRDAGLADCDALIAMSFGHSALPAMPKLKLLQLPGAGYEQIEFAAVPAHCTVCNVFEHEYGMAEYVMAAMLEWQIGIRGMDAQLRQGAWRAGFVGGTPSHGELMGKSVGLVGYGHIGRAVATRAKAFGMQVAAVTRTPGNPDDCVDHIAGMDHLGTLCGEADFIVVACPLTEDTRGLIGPAEFRLMQDHAVLINVARGAVVDEDALFAACSTGTIGGAVIDVWYQYPDHADSVQLPSRHAFHALDNVVMTPHASGWTRELVARRWAVIADNLDRLAKGEPLRNVVQASE